MTRIELKMGMDGDGEAGKEKPKEENAPNRKMLVKYVLKMMREQINLMAALGYGVEFIKKVNADGSLTEIDLEDVEGQLNMETTDVLGEMADDLEAALIPLRKVAHTKDMSQLEKEGAGTWEMIEHGDTTVYRVRSDKKDGKAQAHKGRPN